MNTEKYKIITIPQDQSIQLTIGGAFYQRINKLIVDFADSVKKEHFIVATDLIKRNLAEKDPFAFNFETLIILVRDIEKAFQDANLAKEEEVELEFPEEIKEIKEKLAKKKY
jgi:hypothetical protein